MGTLTATISSSQCGNRSCLDGRQAQSLAGLTPVVREYG
ncbi:hypothetical protein [Sphingobium sp. TKS]